MGDDGRRSAIDLCSKKHIPFFSLEDSISFFIDIFRILENFLKRFFRSSDLFALVRLILPQVDRQRGMFNMKEAMLAKLYGEVFGLPSGEADKLKHFKDPTHAKELGFVSQ